MVENQKLFRVPISRSFHGRDIFASIAAHIACGIPIELIGKEIDQSTLVRLDRGKYIKKVKENCIELKVFTIDKFGNIVLSPSIRDILDLLDVDHIMLLLVKYSRSIPRGRWFYMRIVSGLLN